MRHVSAFSMFYYICIEKRDNFGRLSVLRELSCSFRAFESLMVEW